MANFFLTLKIFFFLQIRNTLRRFGKKIGKLHQKKFYDAVSILSSRVIGDFDCLNFGYYSESDVNHNSSFAGHDERYCLGLYNHLAERVSVKGKNVLEVGSGRGGGTWFIYDKFKPDHMTGIELSPQAVNYSRQKFDSAGGKLEYEEGDAENLEFVDNEFDIVFNVESAHCYANPERFFQESMRVLKPDGQLVFADFMDADVAPKLKDIALRTGFKIKYEEDITENVLKALENDSSRRASIISSSRTPDSIKKAMIKTAGCVGSPRYNGFKTKQYVYKTMVLEK